MVVILNFLVWENNSYAAKGELHTYIHAHIYPYVHSAVDPNESRERPCLLLMCDLWHVTQHIACLVSS